MPDIGVGGVIIFVSLGALVALMIEGWWRDPIRRERRRRKGRGG